MLGSQNISTPYLDPPSFIYTLFSTVVLGHSGVVFLDVVALIVSVVYGHTKRCQSVILGFVVGRSSLSGVVAFVAVSSEAVSLPLSWGLLSGMGLLIWALLHDWDSGPFGPNSLTEKVF